MKYRREIDGLRSFAVVPVILFHAGFALFPGGYVGVDVFFVISGYLITSILIEEMDNGSYSLVSFYERRARRILPALFVVVLFCIALGWFWMFPSRFQDLGKSIIAVQFFVSNVLFWKSEGYFAPASELYPLLHTWSLAVEEQFYIVFPPLLALIWRFGMPVVWTLMIVVTLASLGLSEWGSRHVPGGNFYLAPSRGWELLTGSLCAMWLSRHPLRPNQWGAALGLAMVVAANLLYSQATPFPSLYAVLPVGGTALIILFAGPATLTGRLLSLRPLVWIGLISYSAYLWHQPLFAFARLRSLHEPGPATFAGLIVLTFVLAYLSWRFVEQPFRIRRGPRALSRRSIFALSGAGMASFAAIAALVVTAKGLPERKAPSGLAFGAIADVMLETAEEPGSPKTTDTSHCDHDMGEKGFPGSIPAPNCTFAPKSGTATSRAILIGDSHAKVLANSLADALPQRGTSVEIVTFVGCPPFLGYDKYDRSCHRANEQTLAHIRQQGFDTIIVAFRPGPLFFDHGFDNGEGGVEPAWDRDRVRFLWDHLPPDTPRDQAGAASAVLRQGLQRLAKTGARVLVVHPVPEAGWDVKSVFQKNLAFGQPDQPLKLSTSHAHFRDRNAIPLAVLSEFDQSGILSVKPEDILCGTMFEGRCANTADGQPLYEDNNHLNRNGADLVVQQIMRRLGNADHPSGTN